MTPSININLKPCDAARMPGWKCPHTHCAAKPILIPCSIPRSVTFTVRLGECRCFRQNVVGAQHLWAHADGCPAIPIRVICSIGGKTWEESAPVDLELDPVPSDAGGTFAQVLLVVRERWALVKALLSGSRAASYFTERSPLFKEYEPQFAQRDAVYAALADMVRAEQASDAATRDLIRVVPGLKASDVETCSPRDYLSALAMGRYVKHLIEQVGELTTATETRPSSPAP